MLFRTLWLGGLWSGVYIVRPVLEKNGYFPFHGMEVLHVLVGIGVVCGVLMLAVTLVRGLFNWRQLPQQLLLIMTLASLMYFALMPWWKLQMVLLHALSVLGLIWLLLSPRSVVLRDGQGQ
jgi:predicted MFS family arabinose efflux permease